MDGIDPVVVAWRVLIRSMRLTWPPCPPRARSHPTAPPSPATADGAFTKGSQWLVWKFESDATLGDALDGKLGPFPGCLEEFMMAGRRIPDSMPQDKRDINVSGELGAGGRGGTGWGGGCSRGAEEQAGAMRLWVRGHGGLQGQGAEKARFKAPWV